jgi:VanZ family protein
VADVPISLLTRRALSLWGPVVIYMAAIFAVSSLPRLPSPPGGLSFTAAHVLEYFGLAALLVRALAGGLRQPVTAGAAVFAVALAVAYGATDEWHQHFVPRREMDAGDLLADAVGASAGAVAMYALGRRTVRAPADDRQKR